MNKQLRLNQTGVNTLDFPAHARFAVGFDDILRQVKQIDRWANSANSTNSYPPYDIELVDENKYLITLAVAGFTKDELSIETKEGELVIEGKKHEVDGKTPNLVHKGIATRDFTLKFMLEDYVEVDGAKVDGGLLKINATRHVPEALKPKMIVIK